MFQIGFCISHMETVSIYYPSMCQTPRKGAAVHRRPANWFDTGEKWCMIALASLSLSGCQMALAWGHYKHIRPWFLHSQGVSPQCKYLGLACFPCVDGRPPWPRYLLQRNNKETWRGNRAPFRSLLRGGCWFFVSVDERQTNWLGNNRDFKEKHRRGGNEPELRKWPLSESPALGPHGTARMLRRVFVHFLLREWYTIRKGQYE